MYLTLLIFNKKTLVAFLVFLFIFFSQEKNDLNYHAARTRKNDLDDFKYCYFQNMDQEKCKSEVLGYSSYIYPATGDITPKIDLLENQFKFIFKPNR